MLVAFSARIMPRRSWLFWLRLVFYLAGVDHDQLANTTESIMLTPIRKPTLTRGRYAYHLMKKAERVHTFRECHEQYDV